MLDSHKLIFLPCEPVLQPDSSNQGDNSGPKHTSIFILSWWMDPRLITRRTQAHQHLHGHSGNVVITSVWESLPIPTFPLPSHITPWPCVSTFYVRLPFLAGLPTVISLPLGHSRSSAPLIPPAPPSTHSSHSSIVIIDKRRPPFPKSSWRESHVFTHCISTQQYCCAVERSALCCNMPSLWMLAQWRYPGHLNTQGSPRVIVNQIMIPWLHCIVICVTQPFQYILYHAVTNLEAVVFLFLFGGGGECWSQNLSVYRSSIRYCVSYIFFAFTSLSGLCLADMVRFQGRRVHEAVFFSDTLAPYHCVHFVFDRARCLRHPVWPRAR